MNSTRPPRRDRSVYMSDEAVANLALLQERWGLSRSATIARALHEAAAWAGVLAYPHVRSVSTDAGSIQRSAHTEQGV